MRTSMWALPLREYYLASEQTLDELAELNFALVGLSPEDGAKFPSQLSGVAFDELLLYLHAQLRRAQTVAP